MSDKKQYICQNNENGQIYISEDVIGTIVLYSLSDVEGFAGLTAKTSVDFTKPLNPKYWNKAIKVSITEKGNILLEINALVAYGSNLVTVSENIQNTVTDTVASITGIRPKRVNVNVFGVARK